MRYRDTDKTPTSRLTLNSAEMFRRPGVNIEVPKFATRIAADTTNVTYLTSQVNRED